MDDDLVKKTIAVYDTIASSYAKQIEKYAPDIERNKFINLIPKGAKILDAGCGPGRDCYYFAKHGLNIIGVDLSEKLLEIAKKRVPQATFIKQDLRKLDFPEQSFDGVWVCASLHHLNRNDASRVLGKFFQLLKPNGVLFISVKEGTGEEDVRESLSSGLPRHYVYYKLEELKKLLEKAGFVVTEIYTWREEDRSGGRSDLVWLSSFAKRP